MTNSRLPVFAERFTILRGEMTQAQFADKLGLSRPTVSLYESGKRLPGADEIRKISEKCNVSADYLIGLSPVPTNDCDIRFVCEYTGLSQETIEKFHKYAHLRNHKSEVLDNFDCLIYFFYEQLLHKLYLLKDSVDTGVECLEDMKAPCCTAKDTEYSRELNRIFENLRQCLFSYYELCRRIPNKLFDSDKIYDALEKHARSTRPEQETDLEDFLKNGLE